MVIILDKHKRPLGFTTEKRAKKLLDKQRACIYRYYPFAIIAKDLDAREFKGIPTYRIKIDPGSVHTGIAIVCNETNEVCFYMQIEHRAAAIVANLETRSNNRRNRRERETWYREPKWGNKPVGKDGHKNYDSPRPEGWLPPSVKSIGDNIITWVKRLKKLIPVTECSFEAVRFDSQLLDNPDIEGEEYQHGTLHGYEMKEYLLERYQHTCQYCRNESGDKILEWEHKNPVSRGGSDSVKNATLACQTCNGIKNNRTPEEWLKDLKTEKDPSDLDKVRMECIQNVINGTMNGGSNRYSAWVTTVRRYIEKALFEIFGQVECSSGGRTKKNRMDLGLPKDHHYDALCVGTVPDGGYKDLTGGYVLMAKATGHGTRLRGHTNSCGIITVKYTSRHKRIFKFQTGDIVAAHVPDAARSKYKGSHTGRVMVRSSGSFDIRTVQGDLVTANHSYCRIIQHADGYEYHYERPTYDEANCTNTPIPLGN